MTYKDSKFKSQYATALSLISANGTDRIRLKRLQKPSPNQPPSYTARENIYNQPLYSFSVVFLPLTKEETLDGTFGKNKFLFALEQNDVLETNILEINDEFVFKGVSYIIYKVVEINPDGNYPIMYEVYTL